MCLVIVYHRRGARAKGDRGLGMFGEAHSNTKATTSLPSSLIFSLSLPFSSLSLFLHTHAHTRAHTLRTQTRTGQADRLMKTASADAARREQEYAKRLDAEREAMRAEMEAAQSRVTAVTDEKERLEQHNRQLQLTLVVGR